MKLTPQILAMYLGCRFVLRIKDTSEYSGTMHFGVEALSAALSTDALVKINPVLVLRKLQDMTEEEAVEFCHIKYRSIGTNIDRTFITKIRFGETKNEISFQYFKRVGAGAEAGGKTYYVNQSDPEQFLYLFSKSFDLFGLIDSGRWPRANIEGTKDKKHLTPMKDIPEKRINAETGEAVAI